MEDQRLTWEEARRRYKEPVPKLTAMRYAITYNFLHYFIVTANYVLSVKEKFITPSNAPTLVKRYACRPKLPIRIFYPKSFDATSQEMLPTIFSIHGGGFVIGDPRDDDMPNYSFANMNSVLVIALNYTKAPRKRFPNPICDIEELILAALADSSLPIDHDRVALMGASAGGNLALSVSILPSMCGNGDGVRRIKTVIPLYPVVDMSTRREYKITTRQYKPSLGGFRANPKDFLLRLSPVFDAAYTRSGQDLYDPSLSPIYAPKDMLPPNIFFLGIELDMLAGEAWRMACDLAGREVGDEIVGQKEPGPVGQLILDDERFSFEVKTEHRNIRWLLIPDQIHGFDHYQEMKLLHGDKKLCEDAELKMKEAQKLIGKWLFEGPFA
ncbi:hypothetical protein F53441_11285 [Fusarium austroafricanum]|uniref:Alpha/beta hydrolase fold-3 domain-containing protein n=1 Tax=Fusarium austroafricanum TaxID=2364996 RepID=A0A8H4K5B5_9HYPO|nr:hypothetical protein F53441_11285 [Fusarium austroafricanum]